MWCCHVSASNTKNTSPYAHGMVTLFGVIAVTFMMLMYALEHRGNRFVLAFSVGCLLSSTYGFLAGAWPFGIVELIWAGVAVRRFASQRSR